MSRITRAAAALAGGVLLAGTLAPSVGAATLEGAGTTGTFAAELGGTLDYVALGDSYSAGPLIQVQRPEAAGCLRSTNNYPAFLATWLPVATYTDVTCSGARTSDMYEPQETIVPGPSPAPQLDALGPGTDVVTMGLGGNDYGLFGSMIDTCEQVAQDDPHGAPCKEHFTVDGVDTKARDARRIEDRLAGVVRDIRDRAPDADVYLVGYPRLLPQQGTCPEVPFADGDYTWGNKIERILNRSVRNAAEDNGATYIDLYPASHGHDACAGKEAWINGSEIKPLRAANFHPFLRGERGMARAAYRQITGEAAPDDRFAAPLAPPATVLPPAGLPMP